MEKGLGIATPMAKNRTIVWATVKKCTLGIACLSLIACGGSNDASGDNGGSKKSISKINKEANKVLLAEFEKKYSKCGDTWVSVRQGKSINVIDQFFGIDPHVVQLELSPANELNGYEFRGEVVFGDDATRRSFDMKKIVWSEWKSYSSYTDYPAKSVSTIEKKDGVWNTKKILPAYYDWAQAYPLPPDQMSKIDCYDLPG